MWLFLEVSFLFLFSCLFIFVATLEIPSKTLICGGSISPILPVFFTFLQIVSLQDSGRGMLSNTSTRRAHFTAGETGRAHLGGCTNPQLFWCESKCKRVLTHNHFTPIKHTVITNHVLLFGWIMEKLSIGWRLAFKCKPCLGSFVLYLFASSGVANQRDLFLQGYCGSLHNWRQANDVN